MHTTLRLQGGQTQPEFQFELKWGQCQCVACLELQSAWLILVCGRWLRPRQACLWRDPKLDCLHAHLARSCLYSIKTPDACRSRRSAHGPKLGSAAWSFFRASSRSSIRSIRRGGASGIPHSRFPRRRAPQRGDEDQHREGVSVVVPRIRTLSSCSALETVRLTLRLSGFVPRSTISPSMPISDTLCQFVAFMWQGVLRGVATDARAFQARPCIAICISQRFDERPERNISVGCVPWGSSWGFL